MNPGRIDFLVDIAYGVLIFVAIVLIRRGRRQGRTRRPGEGVGRGRCRVSFPVLPLMGV